ncbi:MAG: DUF2764 domain-containing protein [Treponema sp.]|nr:DUF2764 domain-containing protein [Treponema sp.]
MDYYYLVSQLPNISAAETKAALPLTGEQFRELAGRFISEDEKKILEKLSLVPPMELEATGSAFLDTWYEKERNLRCALAQIRAQKLKKDSIPLPPGCTADIVTAARTAVGMDSPLSAEQFLYDYRLRLLDDLRPLDAFSIDAVYAYGLRLILVERMRKFEVENGKTSYHKIYDTILSNDGVN